jgi:Spy/CpxP family protein refolding chaperone
MDHLAKALNLTDAQKAKVQPILDQARPQLLAIRQDAMNKRKALMQNTHSQIRAVLTPDQQQKLDQMQQRSKPPVTPQPENQTPASTQQPAKN